MIAVTGATGQLGHLVIEALLKTVPASEIVAAVRTPARTQAMAAKGVQVREADYSRPETLVKAFEGVQRVLLISSNEVGHRIPQHHAVIDAAKAAKVRLLAYTSLLHADTSPLLLAPEHVATEQHLQQSGLPFTLLRNGWYFENQTAAIPPALQHGAMAGASGEGRFAAASRADYAAAAAEVLTGSGHENRIYELAGDSSYTRADLAAEVSRQTGKTIPYHDLPEVEYAKILAAFLPAEMAHVIANCDTLAKDGALDDTSRTLSKLTGHPTASLADAVKAALATP